MDIDENIISGTIKFSSIVLESNNAPPWKTIPISFLIFCFSLWLIEEKFLLSKEIEPESISCKPSIDFIATVFPEPLLPITKLTLPGKKLAEILSKTKLGPNGATYFKSFVTGSNPDFLIQDQDGQAGRLALQVTGSAGSTEILAAESTGKVGIGTASPFKTLEISYNNNL